MSTSPTTEEVAAPTVPAKGRAAKPARQMNMTEGPLLGNILLFALPLALSSLLQQLFNTADTMVTGQLVGNTALAGVGGCSPVINLLVNLFTGLSVGSNVVIAIYLGRKEEAKVCQAVHTTAILAVVSGFLVAALGLLFAPPLLAAIGTPASAMPDALTYLRIYFCAMPFMMVYNFGSAILRSKGDTRRPLWCLRWEACSTWGSTCSPWACSAWAWRAWRRGRCSPMPFRPRLSQAASCTRRGRSACAEASCASHAAI